MFGRYAYKSLASHDNEFAEMGPSNTAPVIYVTSSPTFTGPVAGYTTLSSTSLPNSKTKTKAMETKTSVELSSTSSSSLSTSSNTSSSSAKPDPTQELQSPKTQPQNTQTNQFTQTPQYIEPTSTSQPAAQLTTAPQQTQTELPAATTKATTEDLAIAPVATSSSTLPANMIATSLKGLPQSIASPTSTVPKSISLLVASSSTPAAIFATVAPKVTSVLPKATSDANSSQKELPGSTSMNASGKVSLILGIVLFLATGCIMYQLYYRKKRQTAKAIRSQDFEKQSFSEIGAQQQILSKQVSPTSKDKTPQTSLCSNAGIGKTGPRENHHANPFGNHAEIVVDSVSAKGPKVVRKDEAQTPILARGASKRGAMPQRFATNDNSTAIQNSTTPEVTVPLSCGNMPISSELQVVGRPIPAVYRVQMDFTPSMDDELELRSGQLIRVLHEFDDGWAMCIRLDCSEQGVCPRTCLSTRPVKPRSQSESTIGRNGSQIPPVQNNITHPTNFASLPTSPQELSAHKSSVSVETHSVVEHNSPQMRPLPQVPTEQSSTLSTPIQGLASHMIPQSLQASKNPQNIDVLPLKNAARFVSPAQKTPYTPSESSGSVAPVVDYFSFSKNTPEAEIGHSSFSPNHVPNSSVQSIGSETVIPEQPMTQELLSEKPVPGQAL